MPRKVLIAVPPGMLAEIDSITKDECKTRSELIRAALRMYIEEYRMKQARLATAKA